MDVIPFLYSLYRKDEFVIECPHLGPLHQIRIGHDNSGLGPGWYLDMVVVEDVEQGIQYVFSCYKWFEKKKDDGAIVRDLRVDEAPTDVSPGE